MNQRFFKSGSILISLLLVGVLSFCQNKISGEVTNENGDGLERATVQIKGTSTNVITDAKGRYILSSEQKFPWKILVSYTSYLGREFTVSKEGVFNFSLSEYASLGSVTIVGTRGRPRSDVNRPVPVDILSSKELQNTGQIELGATTSVCFPIL